MPFPPTPAAADFAAAARAYDGGDYRTAYAEWKRLAERGDTAARRAIAGMYFYGDGIARDPARARHWYRMAANAGDAHSQATLGEMYETGAGVPKDLGAARRWYRRAAARGHGWARQQLKRLNGK